MKTYHGSKTSGLKELRPFTKTRATVKDACVYMTSDKALAALYIWDKPYYWFTYGFTKEGIVEYTEYFPDSLRYFYENRSGSIYTAEGEFEDASKAGIRTLFISRENVKITEEEFIADVFACILNLEKEGKIKIRRHYELSEKMLGFIRETVKSERESADCGTEQKRFLAEKFPDIK